jgi:hypothetical protein
MGADLTRGEIDGVRERLLNSHRMTIYQSSVVKVKMVRDIQGFLTLQVVHDSKYKLLVLCKQRALNLKNGYERSLLIAVAEARKTAGAEQEEGSEIESAHNARDKHDRHRLRRWPLAPAAVAKRAGELQSKENEGVRCPPFEKHLLHRAADLHLVAWAPGAAATESARGSLLCGGGGVEWGHGKAARCGGGEQSARRPAQRMPVLSKCSQS